MTNLTLNQIAEIANNKLNSNVFDVIDNTLINTIGRCEGNDLSLTIEDGEYVARTTGDTSYFGNSNGYVVANDIAESHTIWTA